MIFFNNDIDNFSCLLESDGWSFNKLLFRNLNFFLFILFILNCGRLSNGYNFCRNWSLFLNYIRLRYNLNLLLFWSLSWDDYDWLGFCLEKFISKLLGSFLWLSSRKRFHSLNWRNYRRLNWRFSLRFNLCANFISLCRWFLFCSWNWNWNRCQRLFNNLRLNTVRYLWLWLDRYWNSNWCNHLSRRFSNLFNRFSRFSKLSTFNRFNWSLNRIFNCLCW